MGGGSIYEKQGSFNDNTNVKQIWNLRAPVRKMLLKYLGLYFESFNVDYDEKSLHLTVDYAVAQFVEALRYKP
jgi:hypothetical protein